MGVGRKSWAREIGPGLENIFNLGIDKLKNIVYTVCEDKMTKEVFLWQK